MKSTDYNDYFDGERAGRAVLARIQNDVAHPDEIAREFAKLTAEAARMAFCRTLQKRLEQVRRTPA